MSFTRFISIFVKYLKFTVKWLVQASKQASKQTHTRMCAMLGWGSLRLAPIRILDQISHLILWILYHKTRGVVMSKVDTIGIDIT